MNFSKKINKIKKQKVKEMKNNIFKVVLFSIVFFMVIFSFSKVSLYSQETKIRIIKKYAVLRLKPNKESPIIKELPLGAELIVEEATGKWLRVKL